VNPYPRKRYSPDELRQFEERMSVQLPSAYRQFLLEVGAGDFAFGEISPLEDWCQPYDEDELPKDFLARPFQFSTAWNDLTLLDRAAGWSSRYFDKLWFCGSMRIRNTGCEGYDLLVVSGPQRGAVWCDRRVSESQGIYPLQEAPDVPSTLAAYLARH